MTGYYLRNQLYSRTLIPLLHLHGKKGWQPQAVPAKEPEVPHIKQSRNHYLNSLPDNYYSRASEDTQNVSMQVKDWMLYPVYCLMCGQVLNKNGLC